jgi:very-short-patch-repair endonuclease
MPLYRHRLKKYSRELRKTMTEPELYLWSRLKQKQLVDNQFYWQRILGDYIVDLYCPTASLVIEIDGGQHYNEEMIRKDAHRDQYLVSQGITVLRFNNADVLENIEGVVLKILEQL